MLVAELNGVIASAPTTGNLVVTGIVNGKRANIFVGNGFKAGASLDGECYVEPNKNAVSPKGTPQYNFVMMVSTKALQNQAIRQNMVTSQAMADAQVKAALAGLE